MLLILIGVLNYWHLGGKPVLTIAVVVEAAGLRFNTLTLGLNFRQLINYTYVLFKIPLNDNSVEMFRRGSKVQTAAINIQE